MDKREVAAGAVSFGMMAALMLMVLGGGLDDAMLTVPGQVLAAAMTLAALPLLRAPKNGTAARKD